MTLCRDKFYEGAWRRYYYECDCCGSTSRHAVNGEELDALLDEWEPGWEPGVQKGEHTCPDCSRSLKKAEEKGVFT
jgi:hypothetical protein